MNLTNQYINVYFILIVEESRKKLEISVFIETNFRNLLGKKVFKMNFKHIRYLEESEII